MLKEQKHHGTGSVFGDLVDDLLLGDLSQGHLVHPDANVCAPVEDALRSSLCNHRNNKYNDVKWLSWFWRAHSQLSTS